MTARPARAVELAVLVVASAGATLTRFVALRAWVFAGPRRTGIVRRAVEAAGEPA